VFITLSDTTVLCNLCRSTQQSSKIGRWVPGALQLSRLVGGGKIMRAWPLNPVVPGVRIHTQNCPIGADPERITAVYAEAGSVPGVHLRLHACDASPARASGHPAVFRGHAPHGASNVDHFGAIRPDPTPAGRSPQHRTARLPRVASGTAVTRGERVPCISDKNLLCRLDQMSSTLRKRINSDCVAATSPAETN
jgi:hypothetical protein